MREKDECGSLRRGGRAGLERSSVFIPGEYYEHWSRKWLSCVLRGDELLCMSRGRERIYRAERGVRSTRFGAEGNVCAFCEPVVYSNKCVDSMLDKRFIVHKHRHSLHFDCTKVTATVDVLPEKWVKRVHCSMLTLGVALFPSSAWYVWASVSLPFSTVHFLLNGQMEGT